MIRVIRASPIIYSPKPLALCRLCIIFIFYVTRLVIYGHRIYIHVQTYKLIVNHPHLKVWACPVRDMGNWLTRRHRNMQKLEERNTYTPTDIPQVCGNCGLPLNREETLSVSGLKTSSNSSDAALIGFRSSETGISIEMSLLQKLLSTDKRTRPPIRYSASNHSVRRGTLLHTLKSVVSATPAPHGVL
jgi:hypothetical protein